MQRVSFRQLMENMYSPEKDAEHIDTKSMKAIRTGIGVRENFWDDFLQVCNNTDAIAELLGVRPEQVGSWGGRIKHNLDRVHKADDAGDGDNKPQTKVLDTGNELGGIAMNNI